MGLESTENVKMALLYLMVGEDVHVRYGRHSYTTLGPSRLETIAAESFEVRYSWNEFEEIFRFYPHEVDRIIIGEKYGPIIQLISTFESVTKEVRDGQRPPHSRRARSAGGG